MVAHLIKHDYLPPVNQLQQIYAESAKTPLRLACCGSLRISTACSQCHFLLVVLGEWSILPGWVMQDMSLSANIQHNNRDL
jgi:hypothetical protein